MSASDAVRQELAAARAMADTLIGIFGASGLGVMQLDAQARIVKLNELAPDMLKKGRMSFKTGWRLFARNRQDDRELQRILSRALPPPGTQGVAGAAPVRRPDCLPPLMLHITPLSGSDINVHSWPFGALVLIIDPVTDVGIEPARIKAAFGLTRSEAEVAALLARGKDVREIAASTHRAESTIRFHVKRILAKLGLTRQVVLVLLVRSLRIFR